MIYPLTKEIYTHALRVISLILILLSLALLSRIKVNVQETSAYQITYQTGCTEEHSFIAPSKIAVSFTFATNTVDSGNNSAATPTVNSSAALTNPVNSDTNPTVSADGMGALFSANSVSFSMFEAPTMRHDFPCITQNIGSNVMGTLKARSQNSSQVSTAIVGFEDVSTETNIGAYTQFNFSGGAYNTIESSGVTVDEVYTLWGHGATQESNKWAIIMGRIVSIGNNATGSVILDLLSIAEGT